MGTGEARSALGGDLRSGWGAVGAWTYELAKRTVDPFAALVVLVLSAPLLLLIAVAIKLDSPGPVFFAQGRVGLNGSRFQMLKFRSMYCRGRRAVLRRSSAGQGPVFKMKDDPRVTRVGRFLRRTSLDELPQFINVVQGHMSLVGPRPLPVADVTNWGSMPPDVSEEAVSDWLTGRQVVRPGITGLWQVRGRSLLPLKEWIRYDLQYVQERSLLLDLRILGATPFVVLLGRGAM